MSSLWEGTHNKHDVNFKIDDKEDIEIKLISMDAWFSNINLMH